MATAARRRPDLTRDAVKELEAARLLREHITVLADGDEDFIRDTLEGEAGPRAPARPNREGAGMLSLPSLLMAPAGTTW